MGDLERQPGLPTPSRAGEREEAALGQTTANSGYLLVPADKSGQLAWKSGFRLVANGARALKHARRRATSRLAWHRLAPNREVADLQSDYFWTHWNLTYFY